MSRPTRVYIDSLALLHNISCIKQLAPNKKIIAMVKANAYGCGLSSVLPVLEGNVEAFGVASLEEAITVRNLGIRSPCILFQGVFGPEELDEVIAYNLEIVIHQEHQLNWLLSTKLPRPIKVWVKVNTGMHRLGFSPEKIPNILTALEGCAWVEKELGLLTHLACADEPTKRSNQDQLQLFHSIKLNNKKIIRSIANSAAIIAIPDSHADVIRPGIMLYGVSPFTNQIGRELGLLPVMRFVSKVSAIHSYPAGVAIGYGGTWKSINPSTIGVIPVGYGDGYPRHIQPGTEVWINGAIVPIVGRVSMDMITINVTNCPQVKIGDDVELWGQYIAVEKIAKSAGTIPYELLCQLSPRVRK